MSWHMHDDLTGDRIADPAKSGALSILLDNDPLASFDVDAEHYTREALLTALGERLVDHDAPALPGAAPDGPRRVLVGAGETVLVRHVAGGEVVREWLVGPGALDYAETTGITVVPEDPSPAVPPRAGEADAPVPDPAGEGRAPEAATNGHHVDLDRLVDGGHGDGVGPHRSDDPPVSAPEREPDWAARAEDLLEAKWTAKRIAEELHVDVGEVRALQARARGPKGGTR